MLAGRSGPTPTPSIPFKKGFWYMVAIMDWHSKIVLSWRLSNTMTADFCVAALHEVLALYGPPEIEMTPTTSRAVVVRPVVHPLGHWWERRRRRILTTAPSGVKVTPQDRDSLFVDDAVKCRSDAHVAPLDFGCLIATETTSTGCAPFDKAQGLRGATVNPIRDWPLDRTTSRQRRQVTHGNPRSPTIVNR